MKKYDNYKDSDIEWIGEIPEHWEVKRLKNIGNLFSGLSGKSGADFSPEAKSNTKPFINFTNVANNKYIVSDNFGYVAISEDEKQNLVKKGDLLFLMSSENQEEVGKSSLLNDDFGELYLNSFCKGFRISSMEIYPNFLNYLLNSSTLSKLVSLEGRGFTRINLRMEGIENLPVFYPRYEEQTAIANYLDHKTTQIDSLISKKQQFITLLKEERIAVINQAVTKGLDTKVKMKDSGIEWLGEIPEHWEVKPLKYLVKDLLSGVSVNSHDVPITNNEEFGILKTSCVYDYTFRPIQNKQVLKEEYNRVKCSVEKDTIIISRMNTPELVGASGYVSKDYPNLFLPDRLWKTEFFNDVKINVKWLSQVLISDLYKKALSSRATGTSPSMKNISKDDFLTLQIPYSPLEEQNEIAKFLLKESSRVDEIIIKAKQEIELLKEYKTALISEVVTGKVDVRDVVLN